nr:hemicentin-2-like [Crassostrea gigas]
MRINMFLGVVACLLFFNVQSSQGLTARIKPNRTSFVFESGIKPNVTCESDCGNYNWKCNYEWRAEKNERTHIYIKKNNSRIDTPLKENVTLLCYVTHEYHNNIKVYSKRIDLFIKERLLSTATPINDSKNDNDERTNITRESEYAPRNITIRSYGDINDLQEGSGYIEIRCNADCNPECDRYQIYHNGAIINTSKHTRITKDRKNSGRYQCAATNSISDRFQYSTNNVDINIKYAPSNVSIQYWSDRKELREGSGFIEIRCNADCNPECDRYQIYHNGAIINTSKHTRITKDRKNSGRYQCAATNSISHRFQNSTNSVDIDIEYGPKTTSVLRNYQTISGDIIEKEDPSMAIPLRCWSSCNPSCEVAWYKDGQLESRGNPVIKITRDRRMSGVYQCEASGVEGKVKSAQVNVTIQYPPGDVTITPGDDTFYKKRYGKTLHDITCEADCVPECTYTWYREGYSYRYTTGNSLFATRYYYYSDSSRFRCLASNAIKPYNNYSRWITVKVKVGPDNVTIMPSLHAIENRSFTLTCSASCYHGCQSYSWYHDGRSMNQRTKVLGFHRLSKEDNGRYRCQVTDYFGKKSGYYTMNVQYDPKSVTIQYKSLHKHLIEGQDRLTITCDADCQPMCTYLFYQNEKLLNKTYIYEPVHKNMSGRYSCAAKNSLMNAYRNSSNIQNIKIKYQPKITSTKNHTTISAPSLFYVNVSVDSFPSSRVSISNERKRLKYLPNVTGQLSFKVSIESCLDQGEYKVEAVNEAGSDNFIFIADVKCSPIIVRYSNLSQKGYQVGDSLSYTVAYKAEPKAEVSWSFVRWNKKESKEIREPQIQNDKEYTMIEISRLNFSNFGKYKLELKNDLGSITQEFHIQGAPQRPTDLVVDCPHSAIISWRPGFDGGTTQNFIIEYSDNSSFWQTHRSESVVPIDETFMSARIKDIQPNVPYSFRIWANNSFGVAESDTTVNCTRQNIDKTASFIDNPNALVGIGILVLLLLIATAVLIAVLKLKRKRGSNNQDNSLRKQGNESHEDDNASEIVENILYITADDAKEQIQAPEATTENPQNGSDVYAVVEKKPKPDDVDDQPVYTDVCKADQKKKKPAIAAKPSKVKKDERPTVNKDGLIYVDLDLKDTPSTSTEAFVIHGADDRTQYVDIDFTRRADPPPDTDNEQSQNEKEKEKA